MVAGPIGIILNNNVVPYAIGSFSMFWVIDRLAGFA